MPVRLAELRGDALAELRMGIDAGTDGGAALGQSVQARADGFHPRHAVAYLGGPA